MPRILPPYPTIRAELRAGQVIPFLGSGASLRSRNPKNAPWRQLLDPVQDQWSISYIPTASELAEYLAGQASFPDKQKELAKVAQYFDAVNGRGVLHKRLDEIFNRDHQFTSLHAYLARSAKNFKPLLIVTTNYDDLIERAFDAEGAPYDLVVHTTNPEIGSKLLWRQHGQAEPQEVLAKEVSTDLDKITVIYKMHGAVDRQQQDRAQYVITEDDYIDFLSRMITKSAIPDIFAEPFQTRHFLFLGYGLYDWNLRVVLNRIEKEFRRPNQRIVSWAIQLKPNPVEQKLWQGRNVEVFYQDIEEFVSKLQPAPAQPAAGSERAGADNDAGRE